MSALRSVLAASADSLEAALESACDGVAFDLSDERRAVGALRQAALQALPKIRAAGKQALTRVNHPRTRLLRDDLDALVTPDLSAVLLPHATDPQDVRDLAVLLREFEYGRGIEPGTVAVYPVIDTARGLLRAAEIAHAAPRVGGLVFDSARYAADAGARDEERGPRMAYARGAIVAAARANDGRPLLLGDTHEFRHFAQYGFAGAIFTSAASVALANAAFTPLSAAIEQAKAAATAYDAVRAEGGWVARLDGGIVDGHAARKARLLLD